MIEIRDLADEIRETYTPNPNEDFPYLGLDNVLPQTLHIDSISSSTEVGSTKYKFQKGDILFGTLRPYFKKLVKPDFDGVCSTEYSVIRTKNEKDKDFLFYAMALDNFIDYATVNSNGARPRTKWNLYSNYEIGSFSSTQRERLGTILSAYDDLIENNCRRIQLLEESARLLYREWFVHFRFPGHEHVEIVDGLPQGWERVKVGEIAETIGGGTPSTNISEYWENGDIVWFTPTDLTRNDCLVLLDSDKKITALGLKKSSAKILPPETILMTSRASIGFFGIFEGEACTNQGFISIIPKLENFKMYFLHNLMSRKEEIISRAGGTTYREINKTTFRNMEVVIPNKSLLAQFEKYSYDIFQNVRVLKKQTEGLKKARDILLPKLMSGEIAV